MSKNLHDLLSVKSLVSNPKSYCEITSKQLKEGGMHDILSNMQREPSSGDKLSTEGRPFLSHRIPAPIKVNGSFATDEAPDRKIVYKFFRSGFQSQGRMLPTR